MNYGKQFTDFISQFAPNNLIDSENILEINKKLFSVSKKQKELIEKIDQSIQLEPFSTGMPLGEIKNKMFQPSLALLDLLAKNSDKKAFIDSEAETHFLYGKDVFDKGIKKLFLYLWKPIIYK